METDPAKLARSGGEVEEFMDGPQAFESLREDDTIACAPKDWRRVTVHQAYTRISVVGSTDKFFQDVLR